MYIPSGGDTLFLSHQNADPDAIGSLYILGSRYEGHIGLPDKPSAVGKRLAEYLELDYRVCPDVSVYEKIVVVDTPDPNQLNPIELEESDLLVIDHHKTNLWEREVFFRDRTSCAEIIYDIIEPSELTEKEGVALLAGIIADTSNLRRGDSLTFKTLSEIMSLSNVTIEQVLSILSSKRSYSENICRLKGAKRSSFQKANGYIVAYSKVSSYESSVCKMLLSAGADVAFVASQRGNDVLISARAKSELLKKGFDVGKIFKNTSESFKGLSGSGHPGAGVIQGEGDAENSLSYIVDKALEMIRESGIEKPLF